MTEKYCIEEPCSYQDPKIELVWVFEGAYSKLWCPMCTRIYAECFCPYIPAYFDHLKKLRDKK